MFNLHKFIYYRKSVIDRIEEDISDDIGDDDNKMDEEATAGDVGTTMASNVVLLSSNVGAVTLDTTTEVVLPSLAPDGAVLLSSNAVMLDTAAEVVLPPLAPDDAVQPSMGSSKISGGKLRGLAHGNVLNHADFTHTTLEFETPVKGEVYLYLTDEYPRNVNFDHLKGESELVVIVKAVSSFAPILDMVAHKFSIIQSEYFYFLKYILNLNFNLDQDYHIYYRRSTKWIALGSFDQAMQDNDECEWEILDGNIYELHLLIVSSNPTSILWNLI